MKKIFKLPEMLLRRSVLARKIRAYDHALDKSGTYRQSPLKAGFYKSTIDELLEAPGLTRKLQHSDLRRAPEKGKGAYFSWELPAFVWEALLKSRTLNTLVTEYLGPKARLDDLKVKTIEDGHKSVSGGWHDDNVGYRLKLFMVFDTEGQPSGTKFIPTARPHLYNVRYFDEISRSIFKPRVEPRDDEVKIDYQPGDCLLFDTNIPHRGDYHTGEGIRYCLVAEFIDRRKADEIVGKAPCGPGQGKAKITIPAELGSDLQEHPLIDAHLLSKTTRGYAYGY